MVKLSILEVESFFLLYRQRLSFTFNIRGKTK